MPLISVILDSAYRMMCALDVPECCLWTFLLRSMPVHVKTRISGRPVSRLFPNLFVR
jgi:hypothetical protein